MMRDFLSTKKCCLSCGADNGFIPPGEICCSGCLDRDSNASTRALIKSGIQVIGEMGSICTIFC